MQTPTESNPPRAVVHELRTALAAKHTEDIKRERFLRWVQVHQRIAHGKSFVYQAMAAGTFPKNFRVPGSRTVVWKESDIEAWMANCIAASEGHAAGVPADDLVAQAEGRGDQP